MKEKKTYDFTKKLSTLVFPIAFQQFMLALVSASDALVLLALSPLIHAVTDLSVTANSYLKWMLAMCSCYMVGKSVNGTTIAGVFCAGGDSRFGFLCDTVTMWCITVPLGLLTAFMLKLPVLAVYFIVNLDEIVKLPAVYRHYKKYKWVNGEAWQDILERMEF